MRCYGTYSFKISDPSLFMQEIAGTADVFYKATILEQIKSEVMAAFQNVLNEMGNANHKIPVLEMPSQTDEIKQILDERVFDEPIRRRGLMLVSFAVESVTLDEGSQKKIDQYELSSNSFMQQGRLTDAYANAVENAASNANGAANGFLGVGMMNMASGNMAPNAAQNAFQNQNSQGNTTNYDPYQNTDNNQENEQITSNSTQEEVEQAPNTVQSEQASEVNTESGIIICSDCGNKNPEGAKFCNNCGKQLS